MIAKNTLTLALSILIWMATACNSQMKSTTKTIERKPTAKSKKEEYELAYEFLYKLKSEKADTIIFCKRTCINCCDFFNIFWSAHGQKHLSKFYFDFEDMQTHSNTINVANDMIFEILRKNFNELKNTSVKRNMHKNKDGTSVPSIIDHYCYTAISIYTNQDSIIADRIMDHDFDEYTDFGIYPYNKGKRQTNDYYIENTNSKWNLLLITIENKLLLMPQTIKKEVENLRITKIDN